MGGNSLILVLESNKKRKNFEPKIIYLIKKQSRIQSPLNSFLYDISRKIPLTALSTLPLTDLNHNKNYNREINLVRQYSRTKEIRKRRKEWTEYRVQLLI